MVKGEIVLIPFPFTDFSDSKLRPALILIEATLDITVCFITTNLNFQEPTDVVVTPNPSNNLKKVSLIKTSKIATLEKSLAIGQIGNLTTSELALVDQSLKTLFRLP
jgi:mRNA interferase MazF